MGRARQVRTAGSIAKSVVLVGCMAANALIQVASHAIAGGIPSEALAKLNFEEVLMRTQILRQFGAPVSIPIERPICETEAQYKVHLAAVADLVKSPATFTGDQYRTLCRPTRVSQVKSISWIIWQILRRQQRFQARVFSHDSCDTIIKDLQEAFNPMNIDGTKKSSFGSIPFGSGPLDVGDMVLRAISRGASEAGEKREFFMPQNTMGIWDRYRWPYSFTCLADDSAIIKEINMDLTKW